MSRLQSLRAWTRMVLPKATAADADVISLISELADASGGIVAESSSGDEDGG
jgi:hypothetical protein